MVYLLEFLSGKMHAKYSSMGTMISFIDRHALRIYNMHDIKLSYMDDSADCLFYRAHSFLVTITGAFTQCADIFGDRVESQRHCTSSCTRADGGFKCHKCLHNVMFCERNSVVERYMSAKLEEFLPYIVSLYMNYSFNGASTGNCELDDQVFKGRAAMACV